MKILKKFCTIVLSLSLILSLCGAFAFAATDSELLASLMNEPYEEIEVDNAKSYSETASGVRMICVIYAASMEAYTRIPVSPDGSGYAYVAIKAANSEIDYASSNTNPGNGYVTSPYASVYGQTAFEWIVHSGYRTQSGVTTNYAFKCH